MWLSVHNPLHVSSTVLCGVATLIRLLHHQNGGAVEAISSESLAIVRTNNSLSSEA